MSSTLSGLYADYTTGGVYQTKIDGTRQLLYVSLAVAPSLTEADTFAAAQGVQARFDTSVTLTGNTTLNANWSAYGGLITQGSFFLVFNSGLQIGDFQHLFNSADTGALLFVGITAAGIAVTAGWFGAKYDAVTDDSAAWIRAFLVSQTVYHPGGSSVISKQICNRTRCNLYGPVGSAQNASLARLLITSPGITPICSEFISVKYIGFNYTTTGTTPLGSFTYPRALSVTASLSGATLTVPGGGLLTNASAGSVVQVCANTALADYYSNNYADANSLLIITAITSDTTATVSGPGGTISSQQMYIRGCGIAALDKTALAEPVIDYCLFGAVPGFAVCCTAAEHFEITNNSVANNGGAMLGFLFVRSNVTGSFYTSVNTIDKTICENNMVFGLTGLHTLWSGNGHMRFCLNEYNPQANSDGSGGKNTYIISPLASYFFANVTDLFFDQNATEDNSAPYDVYFYQCAQVVSFNHETSNTTPSSGFHIYYNNTHFVQQMHLNKSGTSSGANFTYNLGTTADQEILDLTPGQGNSGLVISDNGTYGLKARFLTIRDFEYVPISLNTATVLSTASATYTLTVPAATLGVSMNGVLQTFLDKIFFQTTAWAVPAGAPTLDIGVSGGSSTLIASGLDLTQASGYFMRADHISSSVLPAAFVANALGTAGLTFTFHTGGGNWNAGGLTVPTTTFYPAIRRVASPADVG